GDADRPVERNAGEDSQRVAVHVGTGQRDDDGAVGGADHGYVLGRRRVVDRGDGNRHSNVDVTAIALGQEPLEGVGSVVIGKWGVAEGRRIGKRVGGGDGAMART